MAQDTEADEASTEIDDSSSDREPRSNIRLIGSGIAFVIGLGYFWGALYHAPYTVGGGGSSYTLSSGVLAAFGVLMVFGAVVIAADWYVSQNTSPEMD